MHNIGHPRTRGTAAVGRDRRTVLLILAVLALAGVYLAWRIPAGERGSTGWSGLLILVSGFLAGAISLHNARRDTNQRGSWLLISSGSVIWSVAHVWRSQTEPGAVITYTTLFLVTAICLMVGCLRLAGIGAEQGAFKSLLIDLFPPISALLTVVWLTDIGPFIETRDLLWHYQVSAVIHGVAAVALVVVGLVGLVSWQELRAQPYVQTMMAGLAIIAIGDGLWLQRWINRTPAFGVAGDAAFCIGFATIAIAGLQWRLTYHAVPANTQSRVVPPRLARQSTPISLVVLLSLVLGQAKWGEMSRGGIETAALAGLAVVIFAMMWENLVTVRENVLTEEIDSLSERIDGLISQVGRDPLTGLLNRRAFQDRLEYELAAGRIANESVAIALIDVDDFKSVNDSLGHAVGDQVLQAVASILIGAARTSDVAARYAGDEFVLIFPGVDETTAGQVCQRIVESVRQINSQLSPLADIRIGLSVGMAVTHSCKRNVAQLVAIADAAMYDAKENGKDQVVAVNADTLVTRAFWGVDAARGAGYGQWSAESDRRESPVRSAG